MHGYFQRESIAIIKCTLQTSVCHFICCTHDSTDTDECAQSGSPCQKNEECIDIEGSFVCICLAGFEKNSQSNCISMLPLI